MSESLSFMPERARVEQELADARVFQSMQLPEGSELPPVHFKHLPQEESSGYGRSYPVPERHHLPATVSDEERLVRILAHFGLDNTPADAVDVLAAPLDFTAANPN